MGSLKLLPAADRLDLLAAPVVAGLESSGLLDQALVTEIDPQFADTQAMADTYGVGLDVGANCVVVGGKREGIETIAACLVLSNTKVDVNGFVRKHLNLRKVSFVAMDRAVTETSMEYGGITPVGLPAEWPVLVDERVVDVPLVIIGSGLRVSKLLLPGPAFVSIPGAKILSGLALG